MCIVCTYNTRALTELMGKKKCVGLYVLYVCVCMYICMYLPT